MRDQILDRAAEHHHAVGRSTRFIPLRKPLLQRQDQRIAERGEAEQRDQHDACDQHARSRAAPARRQQHGPQQSHDDKQVGGDREEADDFREHEEHRRGLPLRRAAGQEPRPLFISAS
jgi:hypothetical protein